MKFEIKADLEQEEQELSTIITEFVKNDVKDKIDLALKEKLQNLDEKIGNKIDKELDENLKEAIDIYINRSKFQNLLKKTVEYAFKKLEEKYDLDFATQIIQKMREK